MQALTQRIERGRDAGEPISSTASYFVKGLSQGWAVKLPCSIIAGITMHHLGIVETVVKSFMGLIPGDANFGLLAAYAAMLSVDIFTGAVPVLARDIRNGVLLTEKSEFKSAKLVMGIWKGLAHSLLLLVCIIAGEKTALLSWLPEAAFSFLALTMTVSVCENLDRVGLGGPMMKAFIRFMNRKARALFGKGDK